MNEAVIENMNGQELLASTANPLPMIVDTRGEVLEETRQDLLKRVNEYTPAKSLVNLTPDTFKDRYRIHCNEPLPQYAYGNVKTYAVSDGQEPGRNLYAAVCDPARPFRYRLQKALANFEHQHLIKYVDSGIANISAANECRFMIIYERPEGRPLRDFLGTQKFSEQWFINNIIRPIHSVLQSFEEMGISHSRIHPESIFLGEKLTLGDCISEPTGYSKNFLYEPGERILANLEGRGASTTKVDTYSLGVLAIECLHGLDKFKGMDKNSFVSLILTNGCYNVLTNGLGFSENFNDFLIGVLQDQPKERWGAAQVGAWLGGKRFNLMRPSPPRESSRPFDFEGQQYFSARALAHEFFAKWEVARGLVRDESLPRWIEQNVHKKDVAATLRKLVRSTGGASTQNQKFNDELLSRVITTLDPEGPIRINELSFNIDVIGFIMCDALRNNKQIELNLISEIMEMDLPNFWADMQPGNGQSEEITDVLWKIQRARIYMKMSNLGFGMERFMYEMSPQFPCLSSKVMPYHVTNLSDMLLTLDSLAKDMVNGDHSLVDRHLAAFLASGAGAMKETFFKELQYYPSLMKSQELQVMILLAKAQEKTKIKSLKGICYWVALRMLSMMENIHSAHVRKNICRDVLHACEQGHIGLVVSTLVQSKALGQDAQGFANALAAFRKNKIKIKDLKSDTKTKERARHYARMIASGISLAALAYSTYHVLNSNFL